MGTCSYVLTGTEQGMQETFGSTCHGAVMLSDLNYSELSIEEKNIRLGSSFITCKISTKS